MIRINKLIREIGYTPKFISRDFGDGVRYIVFRDRRGMSSHLEFGTTESEKDGICGQYLYFEIIDWNNYKPGTVIPLNSEKRKRAIRAILNNQTKTTVIEWIKNSLHDLYSGKEIR